MFFVPASMCLYCLLTTSGGARHVPRLERAVPRRTKWTKINRANLKIKLLKSPENNFDIDIFISPI